MERMFESPKYMRHRSVRVSIPLDDLASNDTLLGIQETERWSVRCNPAVHRRNITCEDGSSSR